MGLPTPPYHPLTAAGSAVPSGEGQREWDEKDSTDISVYLTDLAGFFLSKDLVFPSREDAGYLLVSNMVLSG